MNAGSWAKFDVSHWERERAIARSPLADDIHIITHVASRERRYEKSIRERDNWLIFSKVIALHKH